MSNQALTITRRDLRDTLSDWRTLIPLCILSVLLPLILRAGVAQAVSFLDDEFINRSLVPLGLLIAGFLPASLSLIGPLESFVGERERSTLESLLAMPMSDRGLYLAKFFAALLPPIGSSAVAMLIYSLAIEFGRPVRVAYVQNRVFLSEYLTSGWIIGITLILLIKVFTMVAAAVYVSSHTTSIRAANLLASFILIPMAILVQIEALIIINGLFLPIVMINGLLVVVGIVMVGWGMYSFNREELLSRDHETIRKRPSTQQLSQSTRTYGPVLTILRREAVDTLSDWRILTPIGLLTFLVPIGALFATIYAFSNVDNPAGVVNLLPFIVLLVGFLPASFSLIVALEVFVGERERGSLESLFSMPMSDTQLYQGKLLAAIVPPIGASLIAMLLFGTGLSLFAPPALLDRINLSIFSQMVVLSIAQALAMVSAAVVISSHTNTVRLANLLASFILVPIAIMIQLEAVLIIGSRFDVLNAIMAVMLILTIVLMRTGIGSFKRESILSREHLALNFGQINRAFKAFFSEIRPAGSNPDSHLALFYVETADGPRRKLGAWLSRFYRQELSVVWREARLALVVVLIFCGAALIFGSQFNPVSSRERALANVMTRLDLNQGTLWQPSLSFIVISNSFSIFFAGLFSSISLGFFGLMAPVLNLMGISFRASSLAASGGFAAGLNYLVAYELPHGLLEIPLSIMAAALALRLGASLAFVPPTYSAGRHLLWAWAMYLKVFCLVIVPGLVLAGLIEVLVTPAVYQMVYGFLWI